MQIEKKRNQLFKKEKIRSLRKNYSKADLDFSFPSSCHKIKESPDSSCLISFGNYPPQIRCFDLENLSLKFKRNLDSCVSDFKFISQNWEKILLLRNDKCLEFHTKCGVHFRTKILKSGVDLLFTPKNNLVYISSPSKEVFRLDIKEGKFLSAIKNENFYENTCSGKTVSGDILAFGDSGGCVNFWDPRITSKRIFSIQCSNFMSRTDKKKITFIRFFETKPFECLIGFASGEIILFDLRSFYPVIAKEMNDQFDINYIQMNESENTIICSNSNQIKIWEKKKGKTLHTFDSKHYINHVCKIRNSGLIFLGLQKPKIEVKFIEKLGLIPPWISENFLNFSKNYEFKKSMAKKKKNLQKDLKYTDENFLTNLEKNKRLIFEGIRGPSKNDSKFLLDFPKNLKKKTLHTLRNQNKRDIF